MKKLVIVIVPFLLMACTTSKTDISGAGKTGNISASSNSSAKSNTKASIASSANNAADAKARQLAAEKMEAEKLAAEVQDIQKQSVYFDFDQSVIKPEYRDVIQQQAEFAKAHNNDMVTVQGNADERGSEEYNLALGERRANASKKMLELLGVPAAQITTVSFGEEKPRLTCHEEKCWKENRRDDFVHKMN